MWAAPGLSLPHSSPGVSVLSEKAWMLTRAARCHQAFMDTTVEGVHSTHSVPTDPSLSKTQASWLPLRPQPCQKPQGSATAFPGFTSSSKVRNWLSSSHSLMAVGSSTSLKGFQVLSPHREKQCAIQPPVSSCMASCHRAQSLTGQLLHRHL